MKPLSSDIWQLFKVTRISDFPLPPTFDNIFQKSTEEPQQKENLSDEAHQLASLATHLWRARKRMTDPRGQIDPEYKKIYRPVESAIEELEKLGIRIVDHVGESFDPGMAVRAVSFKPNKLISRPMICEALKPSIFVKDELIQQEDVVVNEPTT